MLYCKKCSRLLDDGIKECPYCGSPLQPHTDTLDQSPSFIPSEAAKPTASAPLTTEVPSALDAELETLNRMLAEQKTAAPATPKAPDLTMPVTPLSAPTPPAAPAPTPMRPFTPTAPTMPVDSRAYPGSMPNGPTTIPLTGPPIPLASATEDTSIGSQIGMYALAMILSPIGLIVGLVMMGNALPSKRYLGRSMVIIVAIQAAVAIISCCCFYAIGMAGYSMW